MQTQSGSNLNSLPATLPAELSSDSTSGRLDSIPHDLELSANSNEVRRRRTKPASENTSTERTNYQFSDEHDKDTVREPIDERMEPVEKTIEGFKDEHELSVETVL